MQNKSFFALFLGLQLIALIHGKKSRIIEGDVASPGQFPHQVSVQVITYDNCTDHICGGSIIDEWHILTAAHCYTDIIDHDFIDFPLTVVAGTVDLLNRSSGLYHDVLYVYMPFSYTLNGIEEYNADIAILRLREPLPVDSHPYLSAVKLPASDQYLPPDNRTAVMSGFGVFNQTDDPLTGKIISGPKSSKLRFAYGTINVPDWDGCLDTQVCVETLGLQKGYLEGVCYGDSGGPLYDEATNTLIGVVSHKRYDWCGNVTRFTRVTAYLDFIDRVLEDNIDSTILYTEQSHNYGLQYPKLTLVRPLPLGIHPYLAPILLPRADQYLPPDNQTAVMSGFGVYNETDDPLTGDLISGPSSPHLRFAYGIINIPDWNGCLDTQVYVASLGLLDGGYLEGTCMGDSGGPLFDEENRTLIGVTSHYNYRECGNIGRFTRVSAYLDFLADVILDNYDIPEIIWQELYHDLEGSFPGLPVCEN